MGKLETIAVLAVLVVALVVPLLEARRRAIGAEEESTNKERGYVSEIYRVMEKAANRRFAAVKPLVHRYDGDNLWIKVRAINKADWNVAYLHVHIKVPNADRHFPEFKSMQDSCGRLEKIEPW